MDAILLPSPFCVACKYTIIFGSWSLFLILKRIKKTILEEEEEDSLVL